PLLHEPDLCVAYGAALRAATHGTRYVFPPLGDAMPELELHVTSPVRTRETAHAVTGVVRPALEGGSVRIVSRATGLVVEASHDDRGTSHQAVELQAEMDNALVLTVGDGTGMPVSHVMTAVRPHGEGRPLGRAVLPTQLITKPLQIDVLSRGGQRVKQV